MGATKNLYDKMHFSDTQPSSPGRGWLNGRKTRQAGVFETLEEPL